MKFLLKLPGGAGTVVLTGNAEQNAETERLLLARHEFAMDYCKQRGWPEDAAELTIDQILEIRAQPGWKDA